MSTITASTHDRADVRPTTDEARLRLVLTANALTSTVAGLAAAVAPAAVADLLGLGDELVVRVVGIALLVFAALTAWVARGPAARLGAGAAAVSVGDIAWVLATPVVLAATDLTTTGTVVALLIGLGVADFAGLQLLFRRRL